MLTVMYLRWCCVKPEPSPSLFVWTLKAQDSHNIMIQIFTVSNRKMIVIDSDGERSRIVIISTAKLYWLTKVALTWNLIEKFKVDRYGEDVSLPSMITFRWKSVSLSQCCVEMNVQSSRVSFNVNVSATVKCSLWSVMCWNEMCVPEGPRVKICVSFSTNVPNQSMSKNQATSSFSSILQLRRNVVFAYQWPTPLHL